MNKKGIFILVMLRKIAFITLPAIVILIMLMSLFGDSQLSVGNVRKEAFITKLLYSPHGISALDDNNRTIQGTIDLDKVDTDYLESSIDYDSDLIVAARIFVKEVSGEIIKTAYFNQMRYDMWAPLAKAELTGVGSAALQTRTLPATVISNSDSKRVLLELEVVTPR